MTDAIIELTGGRIAVKARRRRRQDKGSRNNRFYVSRGWISRPSSRCHPSLWLALAFDLSTGRYTAVANKGTLCDKPARQHHARTTTGHTARPRDRRAARKEPPRPALEAASARRHGRYQRSATVEIRDRRKPRQRRNALSHRPRTRSPGRRVLSVDRHTRRRHAAPASATLSARMDQMRQDQKATVGLAKGGDRGGRKSKAGLQNNPANAPAR